MLLGTLQRMTENLGNMVGMMMLSSLTLVALLTCDDIAHEAVTWGGPVMKLYLANLGLFAMALGLDHLTHHLQKRRCNG